MPMDAGTILFLMMVVKIFLAIVLLGYWRVQKTYPGFGLWVAAIGAAAFASAMYALRGQIPDVFSIGLANLGSVATLVLRYEGLRVFHGVTKISPLRWMPIVAVYAALLHFLLVDDSIMARTLLLAGFVGGYSLLIAWKSWHSPEETRLPERWLAFFHIVFVAFLWFRASVWFVQPEYRQLLGDNWVNVVSYSAEMVVSIGITFCLLMMNDMRVSRELDHTRRSLAMEEDRLRRVIAFLPVPLAVYAEDGEALEINEAWLEITGYSREEIRTTERWMQRAYRDDEKDAVRAYMQSLWAITDKVVNVGEREIVTKRGESRFWLFSHAPLGRLPDGRRVLVSVALDVTERRQAELQLHALNAELEERIRVRTAEWEDLYNNAPCGYHSIDGNGVIVRINDTELRWLGYSRDEIVGKMRFEELLTPATQSLCARTLELLKKDGKAGEVEYELVNRSGDVRLMLVNFSALRDAEGIFFATRCSMFDITERKRAERALREREVQLRSFLDSASDPIHMTGPDGRFTYVNEAWLKLFGYTRQEIRYMSVQDLLHPSERQLQDGSAMDSDASGSSLRGEYILMTKERRVVFIETVISVRRENGQFAGTQAILMDVTARKEMEDALRMSRDRMSVAN